ncbi:MAG: glycoside hydrolase family 65 protein [Defluviitaleaceae bacterium]|nr:glycoside hydrolase family 65 protein [Defluviitaleaceae bacterium]MCL2836493.1 glycoside hydrolase family 65 protein [Defluviitaleaceae bacterium]
MNAWLIEREGYEPENTADNGNRFLIGNGFIGVRGTLEEYGADKMAALNLAGIYDRAEGQTWREPVNAPNGLFARLENTGNILKHKQSLDIRHGLHSRETVYEHAVLRIERFASMAEPNVLCQRIFVEPKGGPVTLVCGIDADVWDINGPHLMDFKSEGGDILKVSALTYEQKLPITVYEDCNRAHDEIRVNGNSIFRVFNVAERFVLERAITVNAEPVAGSYDSRLAAHKAVWERLWRNSEVKITGDGNAQLSLNYSLYHLHSIAPRHADGLSIAARGLSGQVYKGAVFWDTEIFLMPFFTLTEPSLARKLVQYRINGLPGAVAKAGEYGFDGAFFPWESQDGGIEGCTDFNVTDVFTNRPVRTYFRDKQIHISGDIIYALCRYMDWTGDTGLWDNGGLELARACAEFYLSRAYCRPGSGVLEWTDVVGPDEYHERVDNNAFTNRMAAFTLERAGMAREWRGPKLSGGVVEQFDGYFALEDADLETARGRLRHPKEYWGTQSGVAFSTKIIKQADVLALMNLFPNEYTDEEVKTNWLYYEPRTEHGSSLSACMYALGACRFGRAELAYPLFLKSARADLDGGGKSWAGNVYIGGTHPAASGGAYMIAAHGFAGLRLAGDKPELNPCLPETFDSLEFPFILRGKQMKARVTHGRHGIE